MPGYHAVTFGSLVAELTTRETGSSFTDLVRAEITEPLGIREFWFQVPAEERHRIAKSFPRITPFGVPLGDRVLRPIVPARAAKHRTRRHAGGARGVGHLAAMRQARRLAAWHSPESDG
ncbi:CubicO group peptidase (beta-lactamase class C family) [Rhodococcus opacus]|nr:CubicO group peptidase (beta-lactamase class C family) [Rhodococcus opacus]